MTTTEVRRDLRRRLWVITGYYSWQLVIFLLNFGVAVSPDDDPCKTSLDPIVAILSCVKTRLDN